MESGDQFLIYEDITHRKQAEEALRESEERYRMLFNSGNDAMFVHHPTPEGVPGSFIEVNDVACERYGYTREDLLELSPSDISAPENVEHARARMRKLFADGHTVFETVQVANDGSRIPVEISSHLFTLKGQPTVISIARDITERKRSEQALRESEEKFRTLAEQSPNMIFINKMGRVSYASQKCPEVMGYKREEFYAPDFDFFRLVAPDSLDLVKASYERHMRGEEVDPYEYALVTKEGKRIEVIMTTKLIHYAGGPAILGVVTDITERKGIETALRKREMELKTKAASLEETNTALKVLLEQRERDKTELEEKVLSNVKELVHPCIERLKRSRLKAEQRANIDVLESHINDLVSPLANMLSSPGYNLTFKEMQVASLVKEGKTNKEIADLLHISVRTVRFHRENIRKKLGLRKKKLNLRSHLFSLE